MKPQRLFFVLRNVLAGIPVACAAAIALVGRPPELEFWTIGALVACVGVGLRAWAKAHNAYGRKRGKVLVTSGPYAIVRNPLYFGSALIIGGVALCSGRLSVGVAAFAWALAVYEGVTRLEQERLAERYGDDYRAYVAKVGRWLPRAWPDPSFAKPGSDLARAVAAESVALLLLVPFLALASGLRPY